jgi:hypothetical protein
MRRTNPIPVIAEEDDLTLAVTTKYHPFVARTSRPFFSVSSVRWLASAVRPASVIARASAGQSPSVTFGWSHLMT